MRRTAADRFWAKVDKGDGCWVWTGCIMPDGYGIIRIAGHNIRVHRFSYELAHGLIPDGLVVCHHCDNPPCVRPDHLFVGTVLDNIRDMERKGRRRAACGDMSGSRTHPERQVRGVRHGMVRLRESDVLSIRDSIIRGVPQSLLADRYGVSRALITFIKQRRLWAHLPQ